ncbi:hypothetical protein ABTK47_19515, partial [Acinetobacter baumannii]
NTVIEHFIIHSVTTVTAVHLIHFFTPSIQAQALGSRIAAPGGGINILNGCEGTEVLFLLIAALLAYPFLWRSRLLGLVGGTLLVFVL